MASQSLLESLKPGKALDAVVERSLVREYDSSAGPVLPYSTNIIAALSLLEALRVPWDLTVNLCQEPDGQWRCDLDGTIAGMKFDSYAEGASLPEALCKAIALERED